jgi:serralysin
MASNVDRIILPEPMLAEDHTDAWDALATDVRLTVSGIVDGANLWNELQVAGTHGGHVLGGGHDLVTSEYGEGRFDDHVNAPTVSKNTQQAGEHITRSDYSWEPTLGVPSTVSFSFANSSVNMNPPGTAPADMISGFSKFNNTQMAVTYQALNSWSDVSGITFTENNPSTYNDTGVILFANYSSGAAGAAAFASFPATMNRAPTSDEGDVWINNSFGYNATPVLWQYGFQVLTHEIGHAIGLEHPGDYNAGPGQGPTWDANAEYIEDTRQYTVMSYFSETNTGANFNGFFSAGPLMDDIEAIQRLYGADFVTNSGNNSYGFSNNTGRAWYGATGADDPLIFCAWDPGGIDTFDFSNFDDIQKIDLERGRDHFSNVGGMTKNISIFDYADANHPDVGIIENAIGGSNKDDILGNAVNNHLEGRGGNDSILGFDGNDSIEGGIGVDTLDGGTGADTVLGGDGNDSILGLDGNDSLNGGADVDTLDGGNGDDTVRGGDGSDSINGGAVDNDKLYGDGGHDTVNAGFGNDTVYGGADNDSLMGGEGIDSISGEAGNDFINGDAGADSLYGGTGADTIFGGSDDVDYIRGEEGNDSIDAGLGADTVFGDADNDRINGNDGADTLDGGVGDDTVRGGAGADLIVGGSVDNDKLYGDAGNDTIDGGFGNDSIDGGTEVDSLVGGGGLDTLLGGDGNDTLSSGDDNDTVDGGADNDSLLGGAGADNLAGGTGADTLDGGDGLDVMAGGTGDDVYYYRGSESIAEAGGAGVDTVLLYTGNTVDTFGDANFLENFTIMFDTGAVATGNQYANIITSGEGSDQLVGRDGADVLHGNGGADRLDGNLPSRTGDGDIDNMYGDAGNDTFVYVETIDIINDTSGTDTIETIVSVDLASTSDNIIGTIETLTAFGTGNINLFGNEAANTITGNAGKNDIRGLDGNDSLLGMDGKDVISGGEGADTIDGGIEADLIYGSTSANSTTDAGDVITGGDGADSIYGGYGNDNLNGNLDADFIDGGEGNDTIAGGALDNDTLLGGGGNDSVDGGTGNDSISSGSGLDILIGGADNDTLTVNDLSRSTVSGGTGSDILVVAWGANNDRVNSTAPTSTADGYGGSFHWYNNGDANNRADYTGIERFNVTTGAGDDIIRTGDGIDTISTGAGDDIIYSGYSADNISGGANSALGADVWIADLSPLGVNVTLDLTAVSTNYQVGADIGSVSGVEQLGMNNGVATDRFKTGSGDDSIVTRSGFYNESIATNGGNDRIKLAGGRDVVDLGGQTNVAGDVLEIDWSGGPDDVYWTTALTASVNGYSGTFYWQPNGDDGAHYRADFAGVERFAVTTAGAADQIRTGDGVDTINSGGGADIIRSGAGADVIDGGANAAGTSDTWIANLAAATANLTIDLTAASSTFQVGAATGSVTRVEQLGINSSEVFATGSGNDTITTLAGHFHENIITNDGRDTVKVAGGRDLISMGAGSGAGDLLIVDWSAGPDDEYWTSALSTGADGYGGDFYWRWNIDDGAHNRAQFSGVERFSITTANAADQIRTGDNADFVSARGGNDIIWTGAGADTIDGGANTLDENNKPTGPDIWAANKSAATAAMTIDLTAASSTYMIGAVQGSVTGIEQLGIHGGEAFSTGAGADTVITHGGFYHDYVVTNAGADWVKIAGGRDRVEMGGQTGTGDVLEVDWSTSGDVFWSTWLTNDTLAGTGYSGEIYWRPNSADGAHNYVYFSGVERFKLATGAANDQLVGGVYADTISSGGGADIIWSGSGLDVVDGGANAVGTADTWISDQSASVTNMVINVNGASSYSLTSGGPTASVTGIEQLGIHSSDLANRFSTGAGDDVITTHAGFFHDWIATNAGADSVKIAGGRDRIEMGGQTGTGDLLTIDWASSEDEFRSSPLALTANGYDGVYYWRWNGDDGAHNRADFFGVERFNVTTGGGADILYTGDNNDTVTSNNGADTILSGKGIDVINGGAGDDKWVADKSFATAGQAIDIDFRAGPATAYLGTGSVRSIEWIDLKTGAGDDDLITTAGFFNDVIATNAGADTVTLFAGRDVVDMGAQSGAGDLLVVNWSTIADSMRTDWQTPTADGYKGVYYWVSNGDDAAHNRVDFAGVERFDVTMGLGHDRITTGDNADTVRGGGGNDTILSGKGADVIVAGANEMASGQPTGPDIWVADKSNATAGMTIDLNALSSTYAIGAAAGTVSGVEQLGWRDIANGMFSSGAGDDVIVTQARFYNDWVVTNNGSDTVTVAGGRDLVAMGGQGAAGDKLVIDWSASSDLMVSGTFSKPDNTGYSGVFYWQPNGDDGAHNRVDFSGVETFDITMGGGNDQIVTGDGNDTIRGGAGDDVINSGRGDDFIDASLGADHWIADKFYATDAIIINLQKAGFSTYMTSGAVRGVESMSFISGSGADKITTGLGFFNDSILGRAGNDVITVAGGRDFVDLGTAGGGGDRLIVDWSASTDGFGLTGWGSDATGYSGTIGWLPNIDDGAHNRVTFVGADRFNVAFGSGADNFTSGDNADTLSGGAGADTLGGGGGNDKMFGGEHNDLVGGGDGDDNLVGGVGQDTLTGGLGKDTFSFSTLGESQVGAADLITDLDNLLDKIDLKGVDANVNADGDQKFALVAAFTGAAGQLVVSFDGTNTLVQGDTNGDGLADFAITAAGDHHDFVRFVL